VIADRAEKAAVMLTTNLPFPEWTKVIPNARLCKALLDRITDRVHIIETGEDSSRFRRTLAKRTKRAQRDGRTVFVRLRPPLRPTGSATAGAHNPRGEPQQKKESGRGGPK